jgi:hypothetical protein
MVSRFRAPEGYGFLDSLVPLLVAGTAHDVRWRATPRIVDVVPLCAELLDLDFELRVGVAR